MIHILEFTKSFNDGVVGWTRFSCPRGILFSMGKPYTVAKIEFSALRSIFIDTQNKDICPSYNISQYSEIKTLKCE